MYYWTYRPGACCGLEIRPWRRGTVNASEGRANASGSRDKTVATMLWEPPGRRAGSRPGQRCGRSRPKRYRCNRPCSGIFRLTPRRDLISLQVGEMDRSRRMCPGPGGALRAGHEQPPVREEATGRTGANHKGWINRVDQQGAGGCADALPSTRACPRPRRLSAPGRRSAPAVARKRVVDAPRVEMTSPVVPAPDAGLSRSPLNPFRRRAASEEVFHARQVNGSTG